MACGEERNEAAEKREVSNVGDRANVALQIGLDIGGEPEISRFWAGEDLRVGDLVGCGISHPCTAFDKWRLIPVVDDNYGVVDAVLTYF